MAASTSTRPTASSTAKDRLDVVVADANWYTTENLFSALQQPGVSTLLLKCIDYYNAWHREAAPWRWGHPLRQRGPDLWQRDLVLPSGWMKQFPKLGMRPIRHSIELWRAELAPNAPLTLVMTYPHYLYLRDQVRPDVQVYFNVDDYAQYWPRHADRINDLERQAVREADLTVCVSRARAEQLASEVPEAAGKVRHLPHGTPAWILDGGPSIRPEPPPDDLEHLPRPLLGYIGSLEERLDWGLLEQVADAFPDASIVLIGRLGSPQRGAWYAQARRCLARTNVHHLGWRPQQRIGRYNRAFDVCLIPYRLDHPFNQVCCPTKIMDYMGTGRPIVSTAVPECRLYAELFDVAEGPEDFNARISALLDDDSDDGRARERFEWAQTHSCEHVATRLIHWIRSLGAPNFNRSPDPATQHP